ncbi:MAG: methionyl-tRNA formyltransferase, partial [Lachnospiraceae bacterium]
MKIIFMGTPDFAVGTLEALIGAGHEVALVVTQPDKPKGRSGKLQYPPVKEAALAHGIEVFQPKKVRQKESIEVLEKYQPDCIVVVAFGQILPKEILEMPKYCCVNVHASLLPKYRGAAPIQWAVINGDKVSGVTTMRMDEGLDTG